MIQEDLKHDFEWIPHFLSSQSQINGTKESEGARMTLFSYLQEIREIAENLNWG